MSTYLFDQVKRYCVELNDAHLSNRQLQVRVDELREEMSLQMSFASNGKLVFNLN